jgi:hyperosmotically inducible periplasmic protein
MALALTPDMANTLKLNSRTALLSMTLGLVLSTSFACATTQTASQQHDDNTVHMAVANKFATDPEIDRFRIDVDALNGVVTLRGKVNNSEQRAEAERIAAHTDGVVKVDNQLEIDSNSRKTGETFEDGWIAVMVDSKLTRDPEVASRNVDVDVYEGVVTLSGIVENQRASNEAVDLARTVDGVTKVVNELQVQS